MTIMRVPKRTSILRSSASDKDRSLGTAKTTRPEMVSVILSFVSPTKSSSGEVSSTLSWDLQDQERRPYSWHFLVCIAFRSQQSTRVGVLTRAYVHRRNALHPYRLEFVRSVATRWRCSLCCARIMGAECDDQGKYILLGRMRHQNNCIIRRTTSCSVHHSTKLGTMPS